MGTSRIISVLYIFFLCVLVACNNESGSSSEGTDAGTTSGGSNSGGSARNDANAQEGIDWSVDTKPPRGLMPNSEQLSSPVDNIDMFSGNLHIQIPVGALPRGRGGSEFSLNLVYNSNLYDTQPEKLVYFPRK